MQCLVGSEVKLLSFMTPQLVRITTHRIVCDVVSVSPIAYSLVKHFADLVVINRVGHAVRFPLTLLVLHRSRPFGGFGGQHGDCHTKHLSNMLKLIGIALYGVVSFRSTVSPCLVELTGAW